MPRGSLLLVDDDRLVLGAMADWLRDQGYRVVEATSVEGARARLDQSRLDLVVCDIRLRDGSGFDVLAHVRRQARPTTVILVTGYATVETAIQAIRAGAFDLLTKPLEDRQLEVALERAMRQPGLTAEGDCLGDQLEPRFANRAIVGTDPRMREIFEIMDRVADTRATVLITGESGTGKSLIARAIHRHSRRRSGPFVEVACGALPDTLLESELFGHVDGAFTGASGSKRGRFMQADQGTIFLDEVGTSSPGLQVRLLRILQDFEFEPVGGTQTFRVDTRVILATNDDLAEAVAAGRFRQDLYYRINVIRIELPPLRERRADIPALAQHFLQQSVAQTGKRTAGFSPRALALLQSYAWPGNLRELQNAVERAVLLGRHDPILPEDLPSELRHAPLQVPCAAKGQTLKKALEEPERQIIARALHDHRGNRNQTALQLGINRTTLYKKMKRLGVDAHSA